MRNLVKQRMWQSGLAGLMYGLAWEPVGLWPLAFVGWALWFNGLTGRERRDIFLHTLLFCLTAWITAFHWVMAHPIPTAAITSGIALLAFGAILAALVASLVSLIPDARNGLRLLAGLTAVACFEALLFRGPFAMPWLSAGLSTAPSSWALTVGSWIGFQGSGLLLVSISAMLAAAAGPLRRHLRQRTGMAGLALALILVPYMLSDSDSEDNGPFWRVRLLEPATSPADWANVRDFGRVDRFASALSMSKDEADITVLPETAFPMAPGDSLFAWSQRLAAAAGSAVLAGGIEAVPAADTTSHPDSDAALNVAYSSDSSGNRHVKHRLVPFAERVPLSSWIPGFDRLSIPSGGVSSYGIGKGMTALMAAGKPIVPLICFESLFDTDARQALLDGGSVLVVMTQDGWWGSDHPRRQHLAFSQMLAASTGHPLIHATVDGRSGLVAADGSLQPLQPIDPWVLSGKLPLFQRSTLFMIVGNRPFFAIFAALALFFLTTIFRLRQPSLPASGND